MSRTCIQDAHIRVHRQGQGCRVSGQGIGKAEHYQVGVAIGSGPGRGVLPMFFWEGWRLGNEALSLQLVKVGLQGESYSAMAPIDKKGSHGVAC